MRRADVVRRCVCVFVCVRACGGSVAAAGLARATPSQAAAGRVATCARFFGTVFFSFADRRVFCVCVVRACGHPMRTMTTDDNDDDDAHRSKPRGLRSARKLRVKRRTQRWNDKNYNHMHCGGWEKANPFQGASHAKGIVVERVYVRRRGACYARRRRGRRGRESRACAAWRFLRFSQRRRL